MFLSRLCGEPIGFTVVGIFVIDKNSILMVRHVITCHLQLVDTEIYAPHVRSHRLHAVHNMRPIATDVARSVVCVSVCMLVILMYCVKTAERIEMPFEEADSCGSNKLCVRWGLMIARIRLQPRGVISRRCGLLPNCFRHLFGCPPNFTNTQISGHSIYHATK